MNQVSGEYESEYFRQNYNLQPETSQYKQEAQSWFSNPSSNVIPTNEEDENENEKVIFSYDKYDRYCPLKWGMINANCDGNSQSPVNLYRSKAVSVSTRNPLVIDGFYSTPSAITIENNGHSAAMRFRFHNGKPIQLLGGPLPDIYNFENAHWHWGKKDNAGSEHAMDARRYAAELHLVTYNSKFSKSIDEFLKLQ